ncbi:carboxy-S-adenosyl-L-methionine synthase CmoA [Kangiella sediminilitoris]|uniref:Carboxy-S-adenosyl-L-methionine synthase n=1 Tax=Kangiella sediminilitoris TaxID=1144748 RepID=A0A1B3BAX8_9GAMM|nr:carboxy-S-adenosyl-L-methionine synthase CmoA [Kangiella sediminilitoris]AOE49950.1 tRNA (cmo5U34)-methyltransferase [Kangiella sediminilitoris]
MSKTDNIYANPIGEVESFRFDQQVVEVFPDMIKRSVPGYTTIIDGIGELAQKYVKPETRIYDLGCSLGAATLSIRQAVNDSSCEIIAVDNSEAMIERCQLIQSSYNFEMPVTVQETDINDMVFENASFVVLNFTLQFLPRGQRQELMDKIYQGLIEGGALILSEKLTMGFKEIDENIIDIHHNFKKKNGYSDMEIAQKRAALENVLIPDTRDEHYKRFKSAGFSQYDTWFQHYNFASLIAVK